MLTDKSDTLHDRLEEHDQAFFSPLFTLSCDHSFVAPEFYSGLPLTYLFPLSPSLRILSSQSSPSSILTLFPHDAPALHTRTTAHDHEAVVSICFYLSFFLLSFLPFFLFFLLAIASSLAPASSCSECRSRLSFA